MYRVDWDSSADEEEYYDEVEDKTWSSCFEKQKKTNNEEMSSTEVVDPQEIERIIVNACTNGDLSAVKKYYLSENSALSPDQPLIGNMTALMHAASYSQDHIVKYLLDVGADPNCKCDSVSALMCACASTSQQNFATLECVKLLIDKKAVINVGDKFGVTPLMRAVMCNKVDVITLLLMNNVNMEMRNNVGRTAIFYAVEHALPEVINIFIDAGALVDSVDRRGNTILMLAKQSERDEIINLLKTVCPDDEDEEIVSSAADELSWCDMLPNTSVATNRSAFSYEIPGLLYGMNCKRLEPLIAEANMNLETFLTLDDENLKAIEINLPYERHKLLVGLQAFHLYRWKSQCVLGLTNRRTIYFDPLKTLEILSCHMKNITIVKASMDYSSTRIKESPAETMSSPRLVSAANQLVKEVNLALKELLFLKQHIVKINKNNLPPAELILPNNPQSKKSFKKTKVIVCSIGVATLLTFSCLKFRVNIHIPHVFSNILSKIQ